MHQTIETKVSDNGIVHRKSTLVKDTGHFEQRNAEYQDRTVQTKHV